MINTTDRPILLQSGDELDANIRKALTWSEALIREQQVGSTVYPYIREAFTNFLGAENRRPRQFDEAFLQAAFDFASSDAVNNATQPSMNAMAKYVFKRTVAATCFAQVKRGIKLALVELWRCGVHMLPTVFTPGPHFSIQSFEHELLRWLLSFDPDATDGKFKTDKRRLYYHGPRLLFATDWSRVEDVSIKEIAKLHLAQLHYSHGMHPHALAGSMFPWSQLPAELLKRFPDRVSFDQSDLVKYSAWSANQAVKRGAFEAFVVAERPKMNSASRPSISQRRLGAIRRSKQPRVDFAVETKSAFTHDVVLALFKRLSKRPDTADWRKQVPVYPGREHVNVEPIAKRWVQSFKSFLQHREHIQGYRSSYEVVSSLNILADYLFLYLPWWRELFPAGAVSVPMAPKAFARFAYVSRHEDESIEALPAPLLSLVRLRLSAPIQI